MARKYTKTETDKRSNSYTILRKGVKKVNIGKFWESIIVSLDYLVSARDLSLTKLVYNIDQIKL